MINNLVSILINTFNSEKFIEDCITSCIKQTYKNIEIVVWDNSSKDNTVKIVQKFKDNRVKLFESNIHTSLGEARFEAIKYLKGEYIAILDSDDLADVNRIQNQISIVNNNSEIYLVSGWMRVINEDGATKYIHKPNTNNNFFYQEILWRNPLIHSSFFFRSSLLKENYTYPNFLKNFQDFYLLINLVKDKKKIFVYEGILGSQRIHINNSIKKPKYKLNNIFEYNFLLKKGRLIIDSNHLYEKKMNLNSIIINRLKYFIYKTNNKNYKLICIIFLFLIKNPRIINIYNFRKIFIKFFKG